LFIIDYMLTVEQENIRSFDYLKPYILSNDDAVLCPEGMEGLGQIGRHVLKNDEGEIWHELYFADLDTYKPDIDVTIGQKSYSAIAGMFDSIKQGNMAKATELVYQIDTSMRPVSVSAPASVTQLMANTEYPFLSWLKKNYSKIAGNGGIELLNPSKGTVKRWGKTFPGGVRINITADERDQDVYIRELLKVKSPADVIRKITIESMDPNVTYYCGFTCKRVINSRLDVRKIGFEINPLLARLSAESIHIKEDPNGVITVSTNRGSGYNYKEEYVHCVSYHRYPADLLKTILEKEDGYKDSIVPIIYNAISNFDLGIIPATRVRDRVGDAYGYYKADDHSQLGPWCGAVVPNPPPGQNSTIPESFNGKYTVNPFLFYCYQNSLVLGIGDPIIPSYAIHCNTFCIPDGISIVTLPGNPWIRSPITGLIEDCAEEVQLSNPYFYDIDMWERNPESRSSYLDVAFLGDGNIYRVRKQGKNWFAKYRRRITGHFIVALKEGTAKTNYATAQFVHYRPYLSLSPLTQEIKRVGYSYYDEKESKLYRVGKKVKGKIKKHPVLGKVAGEIEVTSFKVPVFYCLLRSVTGPIVTRSHSFYPDEAVRRASVRVLSKFEHPAMAISGSHIYSTLVSKPSNEDYFL